MVSPQACAAAAKTIGATNVRPAGCPGRPRNAIARRHSIVPTRTLLEAREVAARDGWVWLVRIKDGET